MRKAAEWVGTSVVRVGSAAYYSLVGKDSQLQIAVHCFAQNGTMLALQATLVFHGSVSGVLERAARSAKWTFEWRLHPPPGTEDEAAPEVHSCCVSQRWFVATGLEPSTKYDVRVCIHAEQHPRSSWVTVQTAPDRQMRAFRPSGSGQDTLDYQDLVNCMIAAEAVYDDERDLHLAAVARAHSLGLGVLSDVANDFAIFVREADPQADGDDSESAPLNTLYIAFRGPKTTEGIADALQHDYEDTIAAHPALMTQQEQFFKCVNDPRVGRIFFTGHCAGAQAAAAATVQVLQMYDDGQAASEKIRCVTFGGPVFRICGPNIGDKPPATALLLGHSYKFYHVVDKRDPVPLLSFAGKTRRQLLSAAARKQRQKIGRYLGDAADTIADGATERAVSDLHRDCCAAMRGAAPETEWERTPLGTLCLLDDSSAAQLPQESAEPRAARDYISGIGRCYEAGALRYHQLVNYAQQIELLRPGPADVPRCFAPEVHLRDGRGNGQQSPEGQFIGNYLWVTVTGRNLLYTKRLRLHLPEGAAPASSIAGAEELEAESRRGSLIRSDSPRKVDMELSEVRNHRVTALVKASHYYDSGRSVGNIVDLDLETTFGTVRVSVPIYKNQDFEAVPAYAERYEDMPVTVLLERVISLALLADGRTGDDRRLNRAAQLCMALEQWHHVAHSKVQTTARYMDSMLLLNAFDKALVQDAPLTLGDPLREYVNSEQPNEAEVVEKMKPVLQGVHGVLECDWLFSIHRRDLDKTLIFAGKVGLALSGVGMGVLLGPAGGVGVAALLSFAHGWDREHQLPFRLGSYLCKLKHVMASFGFPVRCPQTLYFRELIVYRQVRHMMQECSKCTPEERAMLRDDQPLSEIFSLMRFLSFFGPVGGDRGGAECWDELFPPAEEGDAEGQVERNALCTALAHGDRPLFGAMLWSMVLIHEARRLLIDDFALHFTGLKKVGKSTLIKTAFGKDVVCGRGNDAATLMPTTYRVDGSSGFRVVDHPGCDDQYTTAASRVTSKTYRLASHFVVACTFEMMLSTTFTRLIIGLQTTGVPFTVVITQADILIFDKSIRSIPGELKQVERRLNSKLEECRAHMEAYIQANVARDRAAAERSTGTAAAAAAAAPPGEGPRESVRSVSPERPAEGGGAGGSGLRPSSVRHAVPEEARALDEDLRAYLITLRPDEVDLIRGNLNHRQWIAAALEPSEPNADWMERHGVHLDDPEARLGDKEIGAVCSVAGFRERLAQRIEEGAPAVAQHLRRMNAEAGAAPAAGPA
eukprot:TRINITY_DN59945_c0_g1_i1.p1 TRINITY_DN59945_c0_g1~~TRINITY_DN59945_c0_g1_i1.p1  ORF type:complete len:1268 (+),score=373.14 TRINITY_DN59945_c0_g1_i1:130-3933(+)